MSVSASDIPPTCPERGAHHVFPLPKGRTYKQEVRHVGTSDE